MNNKYYINKNTTTTNDVFYVAVAGVFFFEMILN